MNVAALYCRADSVYKAIPGVEVWDAERDARRYAGPFPIVAHPPCAQWGRLRFFARSDASLAACGPLAVDQARRFGGVVEHPRGSLLWGECDVPAPREGPDSFGGWSIDVLQSDFGHRAAKPTRLYVVGCSRADLPPIPIALGRAPCVIETRAPRGSIEFRPCVTKREREATPHAFADWLLQIARQCSVRH